MVLAQLFPDGSNEVKPCDRSTEQSVRLGGVRQLFNKRDYAAAERFWSPAYIQHSVHIAPGREGLFQLVKAAPKSCITRTR